MKNFLALCLTAAVCLPLAACTSGTTYQSDAFHYTESVSINEDTECLQWEPTSIPPTPAQPDDCGLIAIKEDQKVVDGVLYHCTKWSPKKCYLSITEKTCAFSFDGKYVSLDCNDPEYENVEIGCASSASLSHD